MEKCLSETVNFYQHFMYFLLNYTGRLCSSYRSLKFQNCQQIVNGTAQLWRTVECYCSSWRKTCCLSWCLQFALCLRQTSTWKKRCRRTFYSFRSSGFTIITTAIRNDSYLRNFKVKSCGWSPSHRVSFAIKIALQNSGSGNTTNGL